MGTYFVFMTGPGFLHLTGSEKVSVCGNLLQPVHGFIPSVRFILVYSLSKLGTSCLRTQKILYLETQKTPAGDQRPWGIHVSCTEAAHGWGGVRSVFTSSELSNFWE